MSHLLIEKSFKYKVQEQKTALVNDYFYDNASGYWKSKCNGLPLVHQNNQFKPKTKKCDVETGEDRKGE